MIIPMLCVTIFVILVVWFLLPRVARLMIHTPTAISIFVCLSMVQLMAVFISMRCTLCGHFLQVALTLILVVGYAIDRKSGSAGMPRPISYAVFCLKKKMEHLPVHSKHPSDQHGTFSVCLPLFSGNSDSSENVSVFFLIIRLPPRSPLFPYTTLFRSSSFPCGALYADTSYR